MEKKRLAVVTGTRAEYGLLRRVISELLKSDKIVPQVIATGAHLSPLYGSTVQEIEKDGVPIAARVDILKFGGIIPADVQRQFICQLPQRIFPAALDGIVDAPYRFGPILGVIVRRLDQLQIVQDPLADLPAAAYRFVIVHRMAPFVKIGKVRCRRSFLQRTLIMLWQNYAFSARFLQAAMLIASGRLAAHGRGSGSRV